MKAARVLIESMKQEENRLLEIRTGKLNQFARSTPVLILVASLLAIIITIISVMRVMNDYDRRLELQRALQAKRQGSHQTPERHRRNCPTNFFGQLQDPRRRCRRRCAGRNRRIAEPYGRVPWKPRLPNYPSGNGSRQASLR